MQLVSVWSDLYASTLALYAGRAGGHRWLVAVQPEHAAWAASGLGVLEGKGEVVMVVFQGLTPLEAALREQIDPVLGRGTLGVLVVDQNLASGPATEVPTVELTAQPGGLIYLEGGGYPAWTDALRTEGRSGECPAASLCARLGLPVRVCDPEALEPTLMAWWATIPHALIPEP